MNIGETKTRDLIFNISFDVHKVLNDYISKPLYHTTRHFIMGKVDNNVNIVNNRIKLI